MALAKLSGIGHLLKQVYILVRPYGLRRLLIVTIVSFLQALAQVVSVAAVFPFLALAADPEQFESSTVGSWLLTLFPNMDHQQLLMVAGIGLIIAFFVAAGFSLFGEVYRARFTWGFTHWLRMRLLNRINERPYTWFLQQNTSILIKKTTQDMFQFVNEILSPIIDGSSRLMVTVLLLGAILIADPKIALVMMMTVGVTYIAIFAWLSKYRRHISAALKEHWRSMFKHAGQFLSGIKVIRVQGVEREFLGRFAIHSKRQSELQVWVPVVTNGPRYLIEPVIATVLIVMVLQAMASGQSGAAMLPGLGVIAMAGYRLMPAMQMLYNQLSLLQTSRYVLDEIYDELREVEKEGIHEQSIATASGGAAEPFLFESEIELRNVSFSYGGNHREILKDINLIIPRNSSVAYIGETGSGKSTLVDLILGLHRPTAGEVLIDGVPLDSSARIQAWQDRVGYVPQDIFLADDSIEHNIAFGVPDVEIDHDRVRQVATMAQIAEFIEGELVEQYQTEVGERGVRLSGGQRQRIALARALYRHPEVLLLDEATSALDNDTEKRFMDTVYGLAGKYTIIMIAHRLGTTKRVDRRYKIDEGVAIPCGAMVSE